MGIYGLKPRFRQSLRPVLAFFCRFHPDTVSGFAVLCALAAAVSLGLAGRWPLLLLAAPPLFFLRIAFNALDGMVAQERGLASPRGELVNEFSDRVNDTLILAGLGASGLVDLRLLAAALAVTLLVSYLGILAKAAAGVRLTAGPLGKADRMLLLGLGCVAASLVPRWTALDIGQVLDWTLAAFVLLGLVTVANRWRLAWRAADLGGPT